MTAAFLQISNIDIPTLASLLEKRMPSSVMMWNMVHLCLNDRVPTNMSSKFYSFNGNLADPDTAFILNIQHQLDCQGVFVVTLSHPADPTPEMLTQLEELVDWTKAIAFEDISPSLLPYFKDMTARHNPGKHASPSELCYSYFLKPDDALKFDTEADRQDHPAKDSIVIHPLSPQKDLDAVSEHWHNGAHRELVRGSIESVGSAGVYLNDELVCWAITTPMGLMNALYTKEGHRREGYGDLAVKSMLKLNGSFGLHTVGHINPDNSSSKSLAVKLGFVYTHSLYWIHPCSCADCSALGYNLKLI